jgi:accessory gene regulator protein AgrB
MAESICSFRIRGTVIFKVGPAGFEAIVESLPLNIAELLRRRIPAAAIMVWVVLTISLLVWAALGRAVLGNEQGGRSQGENKRWKCKSNELH